MEEIRNKVAESSLITFNLEDLYQVGPRSAFDLADFLFEGIDLAGERLSPTTY
jgi:hypothetical protein